LHETFYLPHTEVKQRALSGPPALEISGLAFCLP
jgi:hypothetical protein